MLASSAAALVVATAAFISGDWLKLFSDFSPTQSVHPFSFNGRQYEIIITPTTRADALIKAEQRGGRLVRIDTAAQSRAVVKAAIAAGCGPIYLWAARGKSDGTAELMPSALAIIPPVAEWTELATGDVGGGFVCELN